MLYKESTGSLKQLAVVRQQDKTDNWAPVHVSANISSNREDSDTDLSMDQGKVVNDGVSEWNDEDTSPEQQKLVNVGKSSLEVLALSDSDNTSDLSSVDTEVLAARCMKKTKVTPDRQKGS